MEKHKILSVKERICFEVEIEVEGMDNLHLTLCKEEDGSIRPFGKADGIIVWQLQLLDKPFWKSIEEQLRKKFL